MTPRKKAAPKPKASTSTAKAPARSAKSQEAKALAPVSVSDAPPPPAMNTAEPMVIEAPKAVVSGPQLRKKELIAAVVARSGIKKKDAKPVVETMLAVLGQALAENRELVLPPMGKLRVTREKQLKNGKMMVLKLRQSNGPDAVTPDVAT